jgi:hypothetical protein
MATLSPEERKTVIRGFELLASADLSNQPTATPPATAKAPHEEDKQ